MTARKRLLPYPEERALEHAAFALGTVPTRICLVLLPVWCVEVAAEVTEGEPYELIDRYLERGIAEAGLDTPDGLARFFALEMPLVGQALRFLEAIGHVRTSRGGRLALTELGLRSVRDQVRYTVTRQDRRKLYFDAFACRPLTRAHYDARRVPFLSGEQAQQEAEGTARGRGGPRVHILFTTRGFRREALAELAGRGDRERYNLPERIDRPQSLGEELVFLPSYVVRAVDSGSAPRYLVYTPAGDEADHDLGEACSATPEVRSAVEAEEADAVRADGAFAERAGRWLSSRGLAQYRPERRPDGGWRVTLPGDAFAADRVPPAKLGSFVMLGNGFLHIWCAEERVRRGALLERIDAYLAARPNADREEVADRIARVAHQLALGEITVEKLRRGAERTGRQSLAAQLARLA